MTKIIFLGNGSAMSTDSYNSCFFIKNDKFNLLVDTAGGHEIIKQLDENKIKINDINNIFISHSHCDHLFGFNFLLREMITKLKDNDKQVNIFCSELIKKNIETLINMDIPKYLDKAMSLIKFNIINTGEKVMLDNTSLLFFDTKNPTNEQYGICINTKDKKICYTGDEAGNPDNFKLIEDSDLLIHEAFCTETSDDIELAKERLHCTAKDAGIIAQKTRQKKLALVHREDSSQESINLLKEEASKEFSNEIIVPKDGDSLGLN
jgi:ribonuclease Z